MVYSVNIPSEVFCDRVLSPLEAVVEYLKEKEGFSYSEIGKILNRDERNIWTVYSRVKKKRNDRKN